MGRDRVETKETRGPTANYTRLRCRPARSKGDAPDLKDTMSAPRSHLRSGSLVTAPQAIESQVNPLAGTDTGTSTSNLRFSG